MADAINGLNPGLNEGNILNPSLSGLGDDPFGFQGYRYHTSLLSKQNARNAAEKEAQYNAKVNYAYWVANNLYNSPAAQMARFQEAGLNPNLIYGKENNVVAGSSPSAHGTVPTGGAQSGIELGLQGLSGLVGMISSLNGLKLQNAQNQKAQAEADVASMRAQNYFLDSLFKETNWDVLELLKKLPYEAKDWTQEQFNSWLGSQDVDVFGRVGPSGKLYSVGGYDKTSPQSMLAMKYLSGIIKSGTEAQNADELFSSLLKLREAQTGNLNANIDFTNSKKEYQDFYNNSIMPLVMKIKEADADFAVWMKSSGILGELVNALSHIF